jgi:hypothetical protein
MTQLRKKFLALTLFAIAMGFLESAVVIYLRELFYPDGFSFPLVNLPPAITRVEILREAATIIMLITAGYLAGTTKLQKFAWFIFTFAIWDLCYYLFLYLCINWPLSLFDWDILFLIPLPWVGPVWAPCLLCILMLTGSVMVINRIEKYKTIVVDPIDWLLLITGAVVCIVSFIWDFIKFPLNISSVATSIQHYIPHTFQLAIFLSGFMFMAWPVITNLIKNKNVTS